MEIAEAIVKRLNRIRLEEDTGEQSELGADAFKFDKKTDEGVEMVITDQAKLSAASAEQWMRSVDTRTADFLRTKFALEYAKDPRR